MADHDSKHHDPQAVSGGEATSVEPVSRDRAGWSQRLNLFAQSPAPLPAEVTAGDSSEWEEIRLTSIPRAQRRDPLSAESVERDVFAASSASTLDLDPQLAAARREISDRDAENVGLRDALGAAHHQLRCREVEIADLTTRLAVSNATTQARQEELSAVALRNASGDEKLGTLDRELKLMHDKLLRAAEAAENRDTKIENLRATRATLEETLKAKDRVISARDEELGAFQQELQAYRDGIASHQKSIADRDSENAMLSDQLLAHQERARTLDAEIVGRERVVAQQREKLAQRDEQLASLLATLDVVERTIASRPGVPDLRGRSDPGSGSSPGAAPRAPAQARPRYDETDSLAPTAIPAEADDPIQAEACDDSEVSDRVESDAASDGAAEFAASDAGAGAGADALDSEADEVSDEADEVDESSDVGESAAADEVVEETEDADESDSPSESEGALDEDAESETTSADDEEEAVSPAETETADGSAAIVSATAFEEELYDLDSAGDLFSQRPPPQPPIFRWWRDHQIETLLPSDEINSFDDMIIHAISRECAERSDQKIAIWSLTGDDAELELRVARGLVAAGHTNFSIECLDDRSSWHEIRADLAERDGLDDQIFSLPASLASFAEDQSYDVFIADGSLAHVADLPGLFERIQQAWKDESIMLIGAVLGSGAAGSSPENIETVDRIWNVMSDRYMSNHLTGEEQTTFTPANPPSDKAGNGGPLSPGNTPLLPLLLDSFCFEVFAAFGNLINAFVGPEIGLNFDPEDESCRSFIERFALLDEAQIDAGGIHPVHMTAVLRSASVADAIMLENRTPERCMMLED